MPRIPWMLLPLGLAACDDTENPQDSNPEEVITTCVLTFTPAGGGDALEFRWADPESDGSPVIDAIVLSHAADYTLSVAFLNELEAPPEDITGEVAAEGEDHQVFFTGSAVEGPATGENASAPLVHAYADQDANGNPVGLENTITTRSPGSGTLTVTLLHMDPDIVLKTSGLADQVAAGGADTIGANTDASATFDVTVE